MSRKTIPLAAVHIASPCQKPWQAMQGDDRVRYCDHCRRQVHNLSQINSAEAQRLVENRTGDLCVCYAPARDGNVQTLDYQPAAGRLRSTRFWIAAAAIGALIASLLRFGMVDKPKPGQLIAGGIGPPPRAASINATAPCK